MDFSARNLLPGFRFQKMEKTVARASGNLAGPAPRHSSPRIMLPRTNFA